MSIRIDPAAVRAAVDMSDLKLDLPDDPVLQRAVNEFFPSVFDAWLSTGTPDPYAALSLDGVPDEAGPCIPPGVTVGPERGTDIRSATCHTIRRAIERAYGADPCASRADYAL